MSTMNFGAGLYDWLLFAHIVAAMVWVGGGVMLGALATRVLRTREPDVVARFLGNLRVIGPRVLAPATVGVLALGVWLVLESDGWGFEQLWVQLALGFFAAAFVIGAAHQSRTAISAERAANRGDHDEALRQLARWSWGYGAIVVLLVAATWDMVFKPGL
jgi:uncharacterized membrane protein